jgi:hypothetical protein
MFEVNDFLHAVKQKAALPGAGTQISSEEPQHEAEYQE